ncbi:MAG TPA: cysteine rich repeat-containing protein [Phenylobacterium sp.]|uniref:cysteine rich repeat-containing protein n=1 Tax=Phenylobacterium sp. TaxID=1871053 RepID=UPI002B4912B5|nr:cysteine rich repeat-containing protein [Phenylobacterium sp.]HKR88446.1 cysteine rich repeat-containing protein [Phenylobacterium sp.]
MTPQILRVRRAARFAVAGGLTLGLMTGAAAAQPMGMGGGGEEGMLRQACSGDVQTLCPGIQPGGGKLKQCLREHADKVSPGCKEAMRAAKTERGAEKTKPAPP